MIYYVSEDIEKTVTYALFLESNLVQTPFLQHVVQLQMHMPFTQQFHF